MSNSLRFSQFIKLEKDPTYHLLTLPLVRPFSHYFFASMGLKKQIGKVSNEITTLSYNSPFFFITSLCGVEKKFGKVKKQKNK